MNPDLRTRRLGTWALLVGLALSVLFVAWLARAIRAPVSTGEVAPPSVVEAAPVAIDRGPDEPALPPQTSSTARSEDTAGADEPGRSGLDLATAARIVGRLLNPAGEGVPNARILVASVPDLGDELPPGEWWVAHLPLDLADPARLGAAIPLVATSDGAGRFAIDGLKPGRARLAIRTEAFEPIDRNDLLLPSGSTVDLGDLRLRSGRTLSGRVVDHDSRPVKGIALTLVDDFGDASLPALAAGVGVRLAEADEGGVFRTVPLPVGKTSFVVTADEQPMLRVDDRTSARLDLQFDESLAIRGVVRARDATGAGVVVRGALAEPQDARVPFGARADAREVKPRPDGGFAMKGLPLARVFELRAGSPTQSWEDASPWCDSIFAYAGVGSVAPEYRDDCSLTFQVLDAGTRSAIGGFVAEMRGATPKLVGSTTGNGGLVTIAGVRLATRAGRPTLRIRAPGYREAELALALEPGGDLRLDAFALDRIPTIATTVVDDETGSPVARAIVSAYDVSDLQRLDARTESSATDSNGRAVVRAGLGAGTRVEVRAAGYAPATCAGPFGGGFSSPALSVRLLRGATARVRVVDEAGAPVAGVRVERVGGDWSPNESDPQPSPAEPESARSRVAGADGVAVFAHLAPGHHAFRVQRRRAYLDGEWSPRELASRGTTEVVLVTPAWGSLAGRVTEDGTPIAGAPLALLRLGAGPIPLAWRDSRRSLPPAIDARADAQGGFRFENLAPGRYGLCARVTGQRFRAWTVTTVKEGPSFLAFEVVRDPIAGRVLDAEGAPVPGAPLFVIAERWVEILGRMGNRVADWDSDALKYGRLDLAHPDATSGDDGRFRILGAPPDEPSEVVVLREYHELGRSAPFVVERDAPPADVEIRLAPAGAVVVELRAFPGARPCVVSACPCEPGPLPIVRRAFPDIPAVIGGLAPGDWWITARSPDAPERTTTITDRARIRVRAGENEFVALRGP